MSVLIGYVTSGRNKQADSMLPEMSICPSCVFTRPVQFFHILLSHVVTKYLDFCLAGDLFMICPDVEDGNCINNGVKTH